MGIESFEAPFITEDRMFVDKHLITSNRAKAMKSGFSLSLPTLGLLSILMLPLAGCLVIPAGSFKDDTDWVNARYGAIPDSSLQFGRENGAPLYICRAEFKGGVHPGKIRSDFGGCNIGWGGAEHTISKYQTLVSYPTFDKAVLPSPKEDLLSDAIEGGHESDGTPLYLCSVDYKGGTHPGKTREGFKGCNIGWGGKEISKKPFSVLVKR